MDPALNRFFDTDPLTADSTVVAAKIPPFFTQTLKTGTSKQLSLGTRVSLADPKQLASALRAKPHANTAYNLYVVALLSGAVTTQVVNVPIVWVRASAGWGPFAGFPLGDDLRGVGANSDAVLLVDILDSTDLSTAVGTRFYVGYGTSAEEMLASGRFRMIYEVAAQ